MVEAPLYGGRDEGGLGEAAGGRRPRGRRSGEGGNDCHLDPLGIPNALVAEDGPLSAVVIATTGPPCLATATMMVQEEAVEPVEGDHGTCDLAVAPMGTRVPNGPRGLGRWSHKGMAVTARRSHRHRERAGRRW